MKEVLQEIMEKCLEKEKKEKRKECVEGGDQEDAGVV